MKDIDNDKEKDLIIIFTSPGKNEVNFAVVTKSNLNAIKLGDSFRNVAIT
jgi:hypothetical protein